jgi:hypothetical protein
MAFGSSSAAQAVMIVATNQSQNCITSEPDWDPHPLIP